MPEVADLALERLRRDLPKGFRAVRLHDIFVAVRRYESGHAGVRIRGADPDEVLRLVRLQARV